MGLIWNSETQENEILKEGYPEKIQNISPQC
jgi:hypothetical protein